MNTGPAWATPAGFLFTATENVYASIALVAIGQTMTYSVLAGALPVGMSLSQYGDITGTPGPVTTKTRSRFVVRAKTPTGASDRTFSIDVDGQTVPYFTTTDITVSSGNNYLNIGPNGESWGLNNQYVNFSLGVAADPALVPSDTVYKYYIGDAAGQLPPGLTLSTEGVISGFLTDNLTETTDASVPKTYGFAVTVTDGAASTASQFNILVVDPSIIRSPEAFLPDLDPGILTANTTYMPPLQFIKGSDLGIVRAQNNIILDVSAYDPYPNEKLVSYYLGTGTTLPPYLNIDYSTGKLHGYIPYQPAYTKDYTIEVIADRSVYITNLTPETTSIDTSTFTLTVISTVSSNVFSLRIKGDVESAIQWVSTSSLGNVVIGETSELAVVAENVNSDYSIKYRLTGGSLPSGLTLQRDGSLSGQVDYNENTGTYTITVVAGDVYELSEIEQTFTLTVSRYNNKKYTNVYFRPFFTKEKRDDYLRFITDESIFEQSLMYRYFDPNFGVQHDIKMVLEFGLEQLNYQQYFAAIQENFYRKRLYFGEIKSAVARNSSGVIAYEVVYVDITDSQTGPKGEFPPQSFVLDSQTYYPDSIGNQRVNLSQLKLNPVDYVDINEYMMPVYMRTAQPGQYQNLNYISLVPLCYTLPGNSAKIITRIKQSGFDFRQFDFEIDRIIVEDSLDNSEPKYLIFEKQSIGD